MELETGHRTNKHRGPTATCPVHVGTQAKQRTQSYNSLVALTGWSLPEEEVESLWLQVHEYKLRMTARAKDVSVERAAVDYFKRLRLGSINRTTLWQAGYTFLSNPARDGRE